MKRLFIIGAVIVLAAVGAAASSGSTSTTSTHEATAGRCDPRMTGRRSSRRPLTRSSLRAIDRVDEVLARAQHERAAGVGDVTD